MRSTGIAGVLLVAAWLGYGLLSTPVVGGLLAVAAIPALALAVLWAAAWWVGAASETRGRWSGRLRVPGTRLSVEVRLSAR